MQVGSEALDAGVADVAPIQEREQVEDANRRQQSPVNLSQQGPFVYAIGSQVLLIGGRDGICVETGILDIGERRVGARLGFGFVVGTHIWGLQGPRERREDGSCSEMEGH